MHTRKIWMLQNNHVPIPMGLLISKRSKAKNGDFCPEQNSSGELFFQGWEGRETRGLYRGKKFSSFSIRTYSSRPWDRHLVRVPAPFLRLFPVLLIRPFKDLLYILNLVLANGGNIHVSPAGKEKSGLTIRTKDLNPMWKP